MNNFKSWSRYFSGGDLRDYLYDLFYAGAVTDEDVAGWLEEAYEAGHKAGTEKQKHDMKETTHD